MYVARLFSALAPQYDRFNRWVSLFRDGAWRRETIRLLGDHRSGVLLDLAAGTGDLAHSALRAGARQMHVFDISFEMLALARAKLRPLKSNGSAVFYEQGSAHRLPFRDNQFDGIVSGFAMRNVFHFLDDVLAEMHRVLTPGGRFAILELSRPSNPLIRVGFGLHMKLVTPLIGKLTTGKTEPFKYLYNTTMTFLAPEPFAARLKQAGFVDVSYQTYLFGGIAIHFGRKPSA